MLRRSMPPRFAGAAPGVAAPTRGTRRTDDLRGHAQILNIVGLVVVMTAPAWLVALFFTWDYFDYLTALIAVPLMLVPVVLLVLRNSRKDPFLRSLMFVGLGAKLAACASFMYIVFKVYSNT